jgi:hypothetical protein
VALSIFAAIGLFILGLYVLDLSTDPKQSDGLAVLGFFFFLEWLPQ